MDIQEATLLLDIKGDITSDKIDEAFKKLASKLHPDKGGDTDDMARINKARDVLQEQASLRNLPAVIKQFELSIKEMNAVAREQRVLEKRVEKSEKEILYSATNKLKSYKNIALILAAISTGAIFLGKDLPKELTSSFIPEVGESPVSVSQPIESDLVKNAQLKVSKDSEKKDKPTLTAEESAALKKYESKMKEYLRYKGLAYQYEQQKAKAKQFTLMWYLMTFGIGIYAGFGTFIFNQKIRRIEEELEELLEDLSFKSHYAQILRDLFEGDLKDSWGFRDLFEAVSKNGRENKRLRPLLRGVGSKKITQLLINKGLESSSLIVKQGGRENGYEETYSLS